MIFGVLWKTPQTPKTVENWRWAEWEMALEIIRWILRITVWGSVRSTVFPFMSPSVYSEYSAKEKKGSAQRRNETDKLWHKFEYQRTAAVSKIGLNLLLISAISYPRWIYSRWWRVVMPVPVKKVQNETDWPRKHVRKFRNKTWRERAWKRKERRAVKRAREIWDQRLADELRLPWKFPSLV